MLPLGQVGGGVPLGVGRFLGVPVVPVHARVQEGSEVQRGHVEDLERLVRVGRERRVGLRLGLRLRLRVGGRRGRGLIALGDDLDHAVDGHRRAGAVVEVRFDGERIRACDQGGRGNEDELSVGSRRGRRNGRGREGGGVDSSVGHALADDLGAVDVHHGAVIGRHGDVDTTDGAGISNREVHACVGGDGAGLGRARGQRRVESGAAVADRAGAAAPGGIIVRGLGPVVGNRLSRPVVCPGVVLVHEQRGVIGLGGLTVGVNHVRVRGRAAQAIGGDGAHEEAVVSAQRDARAGVRGRGDRAVVTQDLVGGSSGHARPLEGHLLGVAA